MNDIIKINYDDTPGTIARDKSRRIAALVVDYFKNDDNHRAFEQWRGERRRANWHELHEEPALEVSRAS
jgi:hypothetical protein